MPNHVKKALETIGLWGKDMEETENICRLCLGNRLLIQIFGSDGMKQQLASKIKKYLSVTVKDDDEMPNKLCYHCATTLIEWHNLVMTATVSEARLKGIFNKKQLKATVIANKSELAISIKRKKMMGSYGHRKVNTFPKLCDDLKSEDELPLVIHADEFPFLGSTSDFYLKSSASIEMTEDDVFGSLGSDSNDVMALEDFSRNSQLETKNIVSITAGCTNKQFNDDHTLEEQNIDHDGPLVTEETVNTSELNFTDPEGISEDPSGEIMVVFYNDHILTENFECLPLIQHSDLKDNHFISDGVELTEEESCNSSALVYEYDSLKEESTTCSPNPPDNEVESRELLHVVLDSYEECQEDLSEDKSHEVSNLVNDENLGNDESRNINNVVVEIISQDNQDQFNNEEVMIDDNFIIGLNANYQCSMCKESFQLQSECLQHFCDLSKESGAFLLQVPLQTKMMDLQKEHQGLCTNTESSMPNKITSNCSLDTNDKLNSLPKENTCEFCSASFRFKVNLDVHRRKHAIGYPISWNKNISNNSELMDSKGPLSCSVCGKTFSKRSLVTAHERTHQNASISCSLCGKELKSKNTLAKHISIHSNARPFKCETCGKGFKLKNQLRLHGMIHSQERNFTCEICASRFRTSALLKQHQLSHSGVRPYECDVCGAAFNRNGNLSIHRKRHAADYEGQKKRKRAKAVADGTLVQCSMCNKSFTSILTLKYHMGRHNGDKYPFDCDFCDKRFVSLVSYRTHIRIHTGERPYACSDCEKTFRSAASLKQHFISLHSDEFPHECGSCDRKFKRLQSLIVHRRTHTGEKNHKCPECGRAFAEKGDMRKHLRTHDNTKAARLKASLAL